MSSLPDGLPRHAVGLAYCGYVPPFLEHHAQSVDYVEIPFELLRHDPAVISVADRKPVVLHCATLSVGGTVPCPATSVEEIRQWSNRTRTPWVGEHLAFITADRTEAGPRADPYAPGEPYNIGYTVSPPMNEEVLDRVSANLERYAGQFPVPLLLENSPLYFALPTSTMTQAAFLSALQARTGVGLLLDLAHFYITSRTMRFDPLAEIDRLPLEAVVEIHVSGVDDDAGNFWDDHARPAPPVVYQLLKRVLHRARPRAVTLEYNWSTRFPRQTVLEEIERTREVLDSA